MPLSPKWKKPGTRVITPVGCGAIGGRLRGSQIEIRLDESWGGQDVAFHGPGEIVLETDFTLLRILNVDGAGIITSAINYPTWEEVSARALYSPYTEDETLIVGNLLLYLKA